MLYRFYFNNMFIVFTEAMSKLLAIQGNNFKICKVKTNYCAIKFYFVTMITYKETLLENKDSRIRKDWILFPFVMMYATFKAVPCSPVFTLTNKEAIATHILI